MELFNNEMIIMNNMKLFEIYVNFIQLSIIKIKYKNIIKNFERKYIKN